MLAIISHFSKNKGTTDYFTEYLEQKRTPYYYLRHPFDSDSLGFSELIFFDGGKKYITKKFKKLENGMFDFIRNFLVSFYVLFLLRKKATEIVSFGGFNNIPALAFSFFYKARVIFWGCDYSERRFESLVLNKLYLLFETLSCKYSDLVINVTERQEKVRIIKHKLDKNKSVISCNGITNSNYNTKVFSEFNLISLLYIGSITKQHGIIDFINYFYLKRGLNFKLYIFGGGEDGSILKEVIKDNNLEGRVMYYGHKNFDYISDFLSNLSENITGIAPYNMTKMDHVYYGDSIKLKEYLSLNIPFITSDSTYVPDKLKPFGFIYSNYQELAYFFESNIKNIKLDINKKNEALVDLTWKNIFDNLIKKVVYDKEVSPKKNDTSFSR